MTERGRKYLSDNQIAIDLIESFTKEFDTFETYTADMKTQSAVERQIDIIGKAVNRFKMECSEDSLENTQQIIELRNRIIHAYDNTEASIVWMILKKHLDPLKQEVLKKL